MDPVLAIAQSGLADAAASLGAAAQGILAATAGPSSEGAQAGPAAPAQRPQPAQFGLSPGTATAVQAGGSDDLVQSMVGLMQASLAFKANLRVFQAGEAEMDATLKMTA